jgi:hypothetical protein
MDTLVEVKVQFSVFAEKSEFKECENEFVNLGLEDLCSIVDACINGAFAAHNVRCEFSEHTGESAHNKALEIGCDPDFFFPKIEEDE